MEIAYHDGFWFLRRIGWFDAVIGRDVSFTDGEFCAVEASDALFSPFHGFAFRCVFRYRVGAREWWEP